MNPSLAVTMQLELLKFPLICTPKIDGVRGWAPYGSILCRSMEPPANLHTRKLFNNPLLIGCDGELCVGDPWNDSACRNTTSALNSIGGTPNVIWHLFDYVTRETFFQTYANRLDRLQDFLYSIQGEEFSSRLRHVVFLGGCHMLHGLDILSRKTCLLASWQLILISHRMQCKPSKYKNNGLIVIRK